MATPLQGNNYLNCVKNFLDTITGKLTDEGGLEIATYAIKSLGLSLAFLNGSNLDFRQIAITYSKIDPSIDALKRIWQLYHQQRPLSTEDKVNLVAQIAFLTAQIIDYATRSKKINCSTSTRVSIEMTVTFLFIARVVLDKEKSKLDLTDAFLTFFCSKGIYPHVALTLKSLISNRKALCYATTSICGRIKDRFWIAKDQKIRFNVDGENWLCSLNKFVISPIVNDLAIPAIGSLVSGISLMWDSSDSAAQEEVFDWNKVLDPYEDEEAAFQEPDSKGQNDLSQEKITNLLNKIQDPDTKKFYEEGLYCSKKDYIPLSLAELPSGVKPWDKWKCGMSGKAIRYIVEPTTQTQPPLYYDRIAVDDWLANRPNEAPKGWPKDKLQLPLKEDYFRSNPALQNFIDDTLEDFEKTTLENLEAEVKGMTADIP